MGIQPSGQNPFLSSTFKTQRQLAQQIEQENPPTPVGSWSTDNTQVTVNGQKQDLVYFNSSGGLVINSADAGGNSTIELSDVVPGEKLALSFNVSMSPPLTNQETQTYNRLSLYYTYTNTSGQQVQQSVPIQLNASGQISIPFQMPSDAKPGSIQVTLHHEKDWGGTPESAIFTNLQFSSGPTPPPSGNVQQWINDVTNGNSSTSNAVNQAIAQAKNQIAQEENQFTTEKENVYDALNKAYSQKPTQSTYNQLKSTWNDLNTQLSQMKQLPTQFESQLQHILTSSNALGIIHPQDSTFTGSTEQMQELWDGITNEYIQPLMKTLPTMPVLPPAPPPPATPGQGSGLSNYQEYQALSSDKDIQSLLSTLSGTSSGSPIDPQLQQAYQQLQQDKAAYQKAASSNASPDTLNNLQKTISTDSQSMLQRFSDDVYGIIKGAPAGSQVALINLDYDSSHAQQMLSHVQTLCTMLMNPPTGTGFAGTPSVPTKNYVPPPQISAQNLINPNAWVSDHGTAGSGGMVNGDSPSGDQGSYQINNIGAKGSDYYEVSQNINTNSSGAGQQYLVAAYVQGPVSNGQGDYLPAGVTVAGDINYNGVQYSPQSYDDSCDTNQWHLVYFVVTTDKANAQLKVSLNAPAGGMAKFSNLQIIPMGSGNSMQQIQQKALSMYPMPSIAGNPAGLGHFPQHQSTYNTGDNLMDWPPSYWENPNTPYPYLSTNPPYSDIVNGPNGNKNILINPTNDTTATATSYSPTLVPGGNVYTYSCQITIPNPPSANLDPTVEIDATDYTTTPATKYVVATIDFDHDPQYFHTDASGHLIPGTYTMSIPVNVSQTKNFVQLSATWSAYKGTGGFSVSNFDMTSQDPNVYKQINAQNPYDTTKQIYNSQNTMYNQNWNFADPGNSDMSGWGISLVGNDISNPEAQNVTFVPGKGIVLSDQVDANGGIHDAGIQSSFMTAPGQPFDITTNMQFNTPNSPNKPVFALWTYGESQKGDSNPLSHKSAGGSDTDNECDFELCPPNAQYPNGYFRAVTYAGWDAGGKPHSFINIPLPASCNLWNGSPHSIKLHISPLANGNCSVSWSVDGQTLYTYTSSPGQPGFPIGDSGTYLKIATEQPYGWPGFTKHAGDSSFTISSIDYTQYPLPAGVTPPPVDDTDYAYYMPGKAFAYTPFPEDFFNPPEIPNPNEQNQY